MASLEIEGLQEFERGSLEGAKRLLPLRSPAPRVTQGPHASPMRSLREFDEGCDAGGPSHTSDPLGVCPEASLMILIFLLPSSRGRSGTVRRATPLHP